MCFYCSAEEDHKHLAFFSLFGKKNTKEGTISAFSDSGINKAHDIFRIVEVN